MTVNGAAAQLRIGSFDGDDALIDATAEDRAPRVSIYRPTQNEVVLGRGSKVDLELNVDACLDDGVSISRRRGGGCAVVLDPGNVIVSAVLPLKGFGDNLSHFRRISGWVIAGLAHLGFAGVEQDGVSDLVLADRKVAGACIYRGRDLLYYSATLLVEPGTALMERYLEHPPREPAYRRGRPHSRFVGALGGQASPAAISAEAVVDGLQRRLTAASLMDLFRSV